PLETADHLLAHLQAQRVEHLLGPQHAELDQALPQPDLLAALQVLFHVRDGLLVLLLGQPTVAHQDAAQRIADRAAVGEHRDTLLEVDAGLDLLGVELEHTRVLAIGHSYQQLGEAHLGHSLLSSYHAAARIRRFSAHAAGSGPIPSGDREPRR